MASPLTTLNAGLLPTAAPEKQQLPLKSVFKLSPHHPFLRRNASPELPQDSNTDALDDNDVLELSMTADSAIACTPPLSVTDSTDDVDDLCSPLSPLPPFHDQNNIHSYYLHHHSYFHNQQLLSPRTTTTSSTTATTATTATTSTTTTIDSQSQGVVVPQSARNHPFDTSDRNDFSLPDRSQIAKRLHTGSSALISPSPQESTLPLLEEEEEDEEEGERREDEKETKATSTRVHRPAVSFVVDQRDKQEEGEEEEKEGTILGSPTLAPLSSPLRQASSPSQPSVDAVALASSPISRQTAAAAVAVFPSSASVAAAAAAAAAAASPSASHSSEVPSFPGLQEQDKEKGEHRDDADDKGVDALGYDLASSLDIQPNPAKKNIPLTTSATTTTTSTNKTDCLLGHILVEQAPSDMLVALFDRPSELQALAARNSDFFNLLYTQVGSAASRALFKQVLFSPREEKCDMVWMRELASHLKAQPCVLEKFQGLVGWVGPDEYDDDDEQRCGGGRKTKKKKASRVQEERDEYDDEDDEDDEDEEDDYSDDDNDDYNLWGEDKYGYRDSSYEQIQIKWIRDFPEQLAVFRREYPQFFINARDRLGGKRLSFGGDRRDLYEIFCETLFLTREQLRCDNAWTRRMNGCLDKHPELLLQLKEIIAYEIGWDD
ncbi:hypothetical protein DFQ27_007874 [Actinomortierella ambigua]|uniref:Uncharacterized protein n=1 Tax=Actinomortierella ambigua TaxID=1343610 RepID=A0A9P6TZ43_9FUNG|nr:hypothetical protein DFQ27_007874 [Actinomortierella ambigua]